MVDKLEVDGDEVKLRLKWPRWMPLVITTLAVIVLLGLLLEAFQQLGHVVWPIFVPLLIALALAYILEPVVGWFERLGLPRRRAILATLLAAVLVLALFVVFVVPRLAAQFALLADRLPVLVQTFLAGIQPLLSSIRRINEGLYLSINNRITRYVENPSELTTPVIEWMQGGGGMLGMTASLFESILIPFFIYYILRDLPKLRAGLELLTPPRFRTTTHEVFDRVAAVGQNFIRGQLTICAIMALLDAIGFLLLGIPMAIFLGVLAGFGHLVPYVGPTVAAVLTVAVTAIDNPEWWRIVGVLGVFLGVQTLESIVLTPMILGSQLELHPFWVLAGITIAGHLFGILGMILATPVIAIGKVLLTYARHAYLHSRFYTGPAPPLVPPPEPPPPENEPNDAYLETSQMAQDEEVSPVSGGTSES
jgi:predicted PurR-regulated permease PerM